MFSRTNHKDKEFVLGLAQEHLTLSEQKYDQCYIFFTNNMKHMVGSEILLSSMLNC